MAAKVLINILGELRRHSKIASPQVDKLFRDFTIMRTFHDISFKSRISRKSCDLVRFTIRGTIINISSLDGSLYPLLYRPFFFSVRTPWRFFSSSWPVLVRYPWKPNRGPSVSLMENRRRRTEGWPLGRRCRSTFHAQGRIFVRVRIAPTRVNSLCWCQLTIDTY